ncbi:MAG: hypothetical protein VX951_07970 [Planctomycetota bacterium]|nr:hypothetical protein [Planctomycetota bacterium]
MQFLPGLFFVLVTGTALTAQNWHQSHAREDLALFLQQSFVGKDSVSLANAYRAVRVKGWLPTASERKLVKRQLRELSRERRARGRAIKLRTASANPDPGGPIAAAAAAETEYNDSEGYATDLGILITPLSGTGTMSSDDDKDCFRFRTLLDGVVTFKLTYTGAKPDLMITSASGHENWGFHYYDADTVVLPLPKGEYHANLASFTAFTVYSLALTFTAQAIPVLALSGTSSHTYGLDPQLLKLVLPQDGRLVLNTTANGQGDSYLVLQSSSWGYIYDVDDTSSASNGEAGLDIQLPRGTYYLYLWSDTVVTESVTTTFTNRATPTLAGSATGVLNGSSESFDLFKMVVPKAAFFDLRINSNGTTPTLDPYMVLYDQDMVQILEGDDDPVGTLSSIGVTLPVGTYYVASTAYYEAGGYQLTKTAGTAVTQVAQAGINPAVVSQYSSVGFRFELATPSWVEMDLDEGGLDGQLGVLDWKTGLAISWEDDEYLGPQYCDLGMHLPAGEFLLVVKDYSSDSGAFDLRILPPLQRWQLDNVMVRGHSGDPLFFVIGTKAAAPNNPFPGLITGNLLVDLSTAVIVPLVMPAGGLIDFKTSLVPNSGVLLQMVEIDTVTALGAYSNLLK